MIQYILCYRNQQPFVKEFLALKYRNILEMYNPFAGATKVLLDMNGKFTMKIKIISLIVKSRS